MPLYEYSCNECGHRFELIQKFSDQPITECKQCQGKVTKLISAPGLSFKGTGWYITDYSSKSKPPDAKGDGGEKKENGDKKSGETSKTEKAASESTKSDSSSAASTSSPSESKTSTTTASQKS